MEFPWLILIPSILKSIPLIKKSDNGHRNESQYSCYKRSSRQWEFWKNNEAYGIYSFLFFINCLYSLFFSRCASNEHLTSEHNLKG